MGLNVVTVVSFIMFQVINLNENQMVLWFCSFSYTNGFI